MSIAAKFCPSPETLRNWVRRAEVDEGRRPGPARGRQTIPASVSVSKQAFDLAGIDIVVNTHLHFDHCGGNHLFAGRPIYVQRRELDDARSEDDYTIREWVETPGVRYVPVDGELELLSGLRLVPAPGHTRGMQVVVVETGGRPVVVGGDVAVWFGELDEPHTEGQLRVRALDPELVWLAHEHEPWRPAASKEASRRRSLGLPDSAPSCPRSQGSIQPGVRPVQSAAGVTMQSAC